MKKNKSLFREEALRAIRDQSRIDEAIHVTSTFAWINLVAIGLIIVGIVYWLFVGTIPIRVHGQGILLPKEGSLFNAVAPEGSGRIQSVQVIVGQKVKKGEILAKLSAEDLYKRFQTEQSLLDSLNHEYKNMEQQYKNEYQKRKEETIKQTAILQNILTSEQQNLNQISDLLKIKQASLLKGITTKQDIANTNRDFYESKREIQETLKAISTLAISFQDFQQGWEDRFTNMDLKISEAEKNVKEIEEQYKLSGTVLSPVNGIVTHIQVAVGEKVNGGDSVVIIATQASSLDALIYIPASEGKKVRTGMRVLIAPTIFKKEEFGNLKGQVISVSTYPSTLRAMKSILQNEKLIELFLQQGAMLEVRVELIKDPNTQTGYAWTSSKGPDLFLTAGTLVSAMVTVSEKRPINLLIPQLETLVSENE